MSRISESVSYLEYYTKKSNEECLKIKKEMELTAYKENRFEDLVKVNKFIESRTEDLSNYEFGIDYEIESGYYTTKNGEYISTEEEFNEIWEEEYSKCLESIETIETDEEEIEIYYQGELIESVEKQYFTEENIFEIAEAMTMEILGGYSLDDLDFEYDEIYWNIVSQYGDFVDEDIAKKVGLAVVSINDEKYLGLTGCGMDFSYLFMEYLIEVYGSLNEKFADSYYLKWLRQVRGDEKFIELMVKCGLDEELLRKYLK